MIRVAFAWTLKSFAVIELPKIPCRGLAMRSVSALPDFAVVVWLRDTDEFPELKSELFAAAEAEPYESTRHQGMVDFPLGRRKSS